MFRKKTVFIVGAGANHEYGMPLGSQLRDEVFVAACGGWDSYDETARGNRKFWTHWGRELGARNLSNAIDAAGRLRQVITRYDSIDEALHFFADDSEVIKFGKTAVAHLLSQHEQKSGLFDKHNRQISSSGPDGKWMQHFFRMASAGLRKSDFSKHLFENVVIIDFNYDRCLQHFVLGRLVSHGFEHHDAMQIARTLKVIKPYGSLGHLPWDGPAEGSLPYGTAKDLNEMSSSLRTFTEGQHDSETEIKRALSASQTTIFLGFGFHQQNVRMLKSDMQMDHQVFATALGYAEENHSTLQQALFDTFSLGRFATMVQRPPTDVVKLHNREAGEMLDQVYFAISAAVS